MHGTMKPLKVNIHDAKTQLSKFVAMAERGARITIARDGKPVAELGPLRHGRQASKSSEDPLLQTDAYSFDGPVDTVTNRDIDRIVYEP